MMNGSGDDEQTTPVEPPPLPENVPFIQVVGSLVLQLSALTQHLGEAVHEMRVARQPIEETSLAAKLRKAFATLKGIGTAGELAFKQEG